MRLNQDLASIVVYQLTLAAMAGHSGQAPVGQI